MSKTIEAPTTGTLRHTASGWLAQVSVGGGQRKRAILRTCTTEDAAKRRRREMGTVAMPMMHASHGAPHATPSILILALLALASCGGKLEDEPGNASAAPVDAGSAQVDAQRPEASSSGDGGKNVRADSAPPATNICGSVGDLSACCNGVPDPSSCFAVNTSSGDCEIAIQELRKAGCTFDGGP
jgi:hypothetical protein